MSPAPQSPQGQALPAPAPTLPAPTLPAPPANPGRARQRRTPPPWIGVLSFVALTYLVTWAVWSILWLRDVPTPQSPGANATTDLHFQLIAGLGMLVPALAALVLSYQEGSLTALSLGVRPKPRHLAWAWLLFPALVLITLGLSLLSGLARYDSEHRLLAEALAKAPGKAPNLPLWALLVLQFLAGVAVGPVVNLPATLGEELGWRGYLLPRLRAARLSPLWALVLSGVIWGVWHAPVLLRGYNYPGHPYLGTLLFIPVCVLLAVPLGWLRMASGSIWPAALAHGALNATAPIVLLVAKDYNPLLAGSLVSLTGCVPLLVLSLWLWRSGRLAAAFADGG